MRKYILTIVGIGFCILSLAQDDIQQKMDTVGILYGENKFNEAVVAYEDILSSGIESPIVYFNLGNAYYKSGDFTSAIINYERALLLSPNDEDILFNLEMARTHVVDNVEELPETFLDKWKRDTVEMNSADEWGMHSVIAFICGLLLFALFLFSSRIRIKKLAFFISVLAVLYSLVTYSFASGQKRKLTRRNFAIITVRSVTVKSSPNESGTQLFIIHEGIKVELTGESPGNWTEIKLADGNEGWVKDTVMVRI